MPKFHIVVAVDSQNGIGKGGHLPWQLPGDMAYFKRITTEVHDPKKRNAVIMGRKTWDSIPVKFRPLKHRLNIVISRQVSIAGLPEGVLLASSLDTALAAADNDDVENIFLIGGGAIYTQAWHHPDLDKVYWTDIHADFGCDTVLPSLTGDFVHLSEQDSQIFCENDIEYLFKIFEKRHLSLHKTALPSNRTCS